MKAIVCRAFAPIDALTLEDMPDPQATAGMVVIDSHAAGINFPDGLIVQGKYQAKPPFPFSPGSEVAGIVRSVGTGVDHVRPGDRVVAFCGVGGYAGQVAVPSTQVWPLPDGIPFTTAAGFIITYGTSWHGLKDRGALNAGETLLVLGAAGGVGLTAVELGKQLGARVIAAASSDEKLALASDYGADALINYSAENLRDAVKRLTDGKGVDMVYDPVGGALASDAIRSLCWNGRYLIVGFAGGDIPQIPANQLLLKSADAKGVLWGASLKADPAHHGNNIRALLDLLREGRIKPHISEIFPLEKAVEALGHVMDRRAKGKVVLTIKEQEGEAA